MPFLSVNAFMFRNELDLEKTVESSDYQFVLWSNRDVSFVRFDTVPGCNGQTGITTVASTMLSYAATL